MNSGRNIYLFSYSVFQKKYVSLQKTYCNMAHQHLWQNEYWLLLIQQYMKKPQGVKPIYSKPIVDLALELHIHPQYLHRMMTKLDNTRVASLKAMMNSYAKNPKKFNKKVDMLRAMKGFGNQTLFYDGVEVVESFEKVFKPIEGCQPLTPMMLIIILDLYFRLTPPTMVEETPEVVEMAKLLKIKASDVVVALKTFCLCDPCIKARNIIEETPLLAPCQQAWHKYGSQEQDKLSDLATMLKEYFS